MENKIYWEKNLRIPLILNEERDTKRIVSEKLKEIGTDLRPVFLQEKHLIKELFGWDDDIYLKSIWCTKNGKYYVDGELKNVGYKEYASKIKDFDKFREKILSYIPSKEELENENIIFQNFIKYNREHLYYLLESEDVDEEENKVGAYPFIEEVIEKYKNRIPMVSFSGGKDSTVVSHLVRKALNKQEILHIFGDTTLELPLTYEYVSEFQEKYPNIPFLVEKNEENDFFEMCKEIGPPSRVKSWCCSIFKTGPMGTTLSNFDEEFLTFYGVRRKESLSRSKYKKIGKTPKIQGGIVTSPIIDWMDIDVWLYILAEKIEFNKNYKNGFPRVGCWLCPNNSEYSQLLAKIYVSKKINNKLKWDIDDWKEILYSFARKVVSNYYIDKNISISKKDLEKEIENYVEGSKWKARQGGQGLEQSKNIIFTKKECVNEKNTYIINTNRKIDKEFLSLFIPFGKLILNNKGKLQEVLVLNTKDEILFKLLYKEQDIEFRLTIVDLTDKHLYSKITRQLNKFNMCIYCQACNSTCKFGALKVINNSYTIDEDKCVHCLNCVTKFDQGCLIASALTIKKGK